MLTAIFYALISSMENQNRRISEIYRLRLLDFDMVTQKKSFIPSIPSPIIQD